MADHLDLGAAFALSRSQDEREERVFGEAVFHFDDASLDSEAVGDEARREGGGKGRKGERRVVEVWKKREKKMRKKEREGRRELPSEKSKESVG